MDHLKKVNAAIEYIESNLSNPITMVEIAQSVDISSWHFQRIFKQYVGETIGSYLGRRRLSCALEKVQGDTSKIIDVAIEYQFGSSEAFSRAFKREYGFAPSSLRKNNLRITPFKKPQLKPELLEYLTKDLKLEPRIAEIDGFSVVGLPTSFISPLAERHKYMEMIPTHWREFALRESEVENRLGDIKVGVMEWMANPKHHIHDDMMDYLACTPVKEVGRLAPGFTAIEIPSGEYAIFTAKGFHKQTQYIIDYVYSWWLRNSSYERREGPEFTYLDHSNEPLCHQNSTVYYYLPIKS